MDDKLPIIIRKKRSPRYIVIMAYPYMNDKDDPDWFVRISYRKNNTHQETDHSIIIKKGLSTWTKGFKKQGYEPYKDFDMANLEKTTLKN